MTRRSLFAALVALVCPRSAQSQATLELHNRIVAFERQYHPFLLKLYGCPSGTISPDECQPALGSFNVAQWSRVRQEACKLFDLEEPPE